MCVLLIPHQQSTSSSSKGSNESRKSLAQLDEGELFMELIKDIANELDIDVLCHKILVNVELLTHADRGSLFLVRGNSQSRYLHAKLFDVTQDTGKISSSTPYFIWIIKKISISNEMCLIPTMNTNTIMNTRKQTNQQKKSLQIRSLICFFSFHTIFTSHAF